MWHIENTYGIKRDEFPDRPNEFMRALKDMFGCGALILEKRIAKELKKEFKIRSVPLTLKP